MIIESIEIKDFLSFYDKNVLHFDTGPTLLIGQNNTGKSKLFDAFNWVLYDKAFKTELEEWRKTHDWKHELVNSLARNECAIEDSITTEVNLTFKGEEGNRYILSRSYKIVKLNVNSWNCDFNSYLYLQEQDSITANCSSYKEGDAEDRIISLFPQHLSKYFLFQGESISEIMSLGKKSAFSSALHDLSRIEVFELAKDYAQRTYNRCKRELNDKTDDNQRIQQEKLELTKQIEIREGQLIKKSQEIDTISAERDLAKQELDRKEAELRNYEECAEILRDIKGIEEKIELGNRNRMTMYDSRIRPLFERWMYAGTRQILENFLEIYSKNKIEKRIPEPIRQDFIREMLNEQKCKVCEREALKGTESYHSIERMLDDRSLDNEIALINSLSFKADSMLTDTNEIPIELKEFHQDLAEIEDNLHNLTTNLKAKKDNLREVIPKGLTEDSLELAEFDKLRNSVLQIKRDISNHAASIERFKGMRQNIEDEKAVLEKRYSEVIRQSEAIEETERYELAKKISESTSKFYQLFQNHLIKSIESEANKCFEQMTSLNPALSGKVKVDLLESEVYTVDESGIRLTNINQANKVSLQIAFVAAVLSVSNSFWGTYFPFIADAPVSALGGNNKFAAIKTMTDIFQQSIIILKDDAITNDPGSLESDLVRQMIRSNEKIKNAYELVMIGETLGEQHTKIAMLK